MLTGLARCVDDVERFLAEHWSQAPLLQRGGDERRFDDLLSLDDVDRILSGSSPRLPAFRLVRDGKPLDPATYTRSTRLGGQAVSGVAHPGRVYREFEQGATIVLQGLHRSWPPLTRFCRALELELTHPVQANAYITPPGARGLAVHYDTHDVFVLQIAGSKHWAVHEPVLELPLASQPWRAGSASPGEPVLDVQLVAGDSLYVPRGFLHSARAQEGVSGHLTIGVQALTWHDAMREVFAGLADEAPFRRPLPVGYAGDEAGLASGLAEHVSRLRDWLEKVDLDAVAATLARRFWSNRPPILTGQLGQVLGLDGIDDESRVRRREGAVCRLSQEPDGLHVLLGDRRLRLPGELEPAVRRLVEGEGLRVGDVADELDGPSRLVLVRRLVREGLLEVVAIG